MITESRDEKYHGVQKQAKSNNMHMVLLLDSINLFRKCQPSRMYMKDTVIYEASDMQVLDDRRQPFETAVVTLLALSLIT